MTIGTSIEWCDDTVNPVMGCQGCELWDPERGVRRCYAGVLHENGKGRKPGHAVDFNVPTTFPRRVLKAASTGDLLGKDRVDKPWLNTAPRSIFISDMGDALSSSIAFAYLEQEIVRAVTTEAGKRHRWLWLTKRPDRMAEFVAYVRRLGWEWPLNLWVGTSVTTTKSLARVRHLVDIPGEGITKFLSVEPQSEAVDLRPYVGRVGWVIQGGESGAQSLVFDIAWVRDLRDACRDFGVPYFLKQLGAAPVENGKRLVLRDRRWGGDWKDWPEDIAVREVPGVAVQWSRPASGMSRGSDVGRGRRGPGLVVLEGEPR